MTTNTMTTRELQERVDRGVKWLDQHLPDWWRTDRPEQHGQWEDGGAIDVDALVMRDPCYCVLGQLLGNYYRAEIGLAEAVACGFDADTSGDRSDERVREAMTDEFDALTELWSLVIDQRRRGVDVAPETVGSRS